METLIQNASTQRAALSALQRPHRLAEKTPIMFCPRRSHLHSCRQIWSCSCEIRAATLGLLLRQKTLLYAARKVPKLRFVGHPNPPCSLSSHSLLWQQLITMFLESLCATKTKSLVVLLSVTAVFGCAQYLHGLGFTPPTSHLRPHHLASPTSPCSPALLLFLSTWFPCQLTIHCLAEIPALLLAVSGI